VIDVAAAAIPVVPGGAGAAIKAVRLANQVDNVVDAVNAVDNVVDAANQIDNAVDAANQIDNADELLYRSMKQANDGLPEVGPSGRTLGVRPDDIPIENGLVRPNTGGMSVSPNSPYNLPPHRRPPEFGGTGKDPVFCMGSSCLPDGLQYRPDPANPTGHGFIEPSREMNFEEYQKLIEQTRPFWSN
jgi:hypothetical protein